MSADLQELFDRAGRNPPPPVLNADAVLHRARRTRERRIAGVVVATVAVALTLGVGLASQWHRSAAPEPTRPLPTAPVPGTLGRLAFGLDGDIYLADGDGRHRVRIADGTPVDDCSNYWAEGPVWSPDGRYLVFRGNENSGETSASGCSPSATVNISDPSGVRIGSFPSEGWQVAWSPDSTRVATWVDFDAHTLGIYGLDGVPQALLTVPAAGLMPGDFDPVWSPDGTSLLLRGGVEVPIDGSAPRQLPSDDPRSQYQFVYSPDGANIASVTEGALSVAAADGSRARVLVSSGVDLAAWFGPVWSPTGDRIAFVSQGSAGSRDNGPVKQLSVVDVASGTVVRLADIGSGADGFTSMLTFSPEGDQILYTRTDATGARSLWIVATDGSDPIRLVDGADWGDWQTLTTTR